MKTLSAMIGVLGLVLAGLQLWLFLTWVSGNRAVDAGLWRVDGLSLGFGVVWCVAVMVSALQAEGNRWGPAVGLVGVGLLSMAYAREPFVLAVGWIVAGLGAWLSWGVADRRERIGFLVGAILPGVLVVLGWIVGWIGVFAPPVGGVGRNWPVGAVLLVGTAVCMTPLGMALLTTALGREAGKSWGLAGVFAACGPFVLAKMLVGGRWDAWGTWVLALLGTAGLLIIVWLSTWKSLGRIGVVGALAMLAVVGLGLAAVSPVAGVGSVVLMALGAIVAGLEGGQVGFAYRGAIVLAGGAVGVWLVVQGALTARYGLVAVMALPAVILVVALGWKKNELGKVGWVAVLVGVILAASAIYPQAVIEWFARPAVEAMAGGAGAPVGLVRNWGVGLQVVSQSEVVLAALPATGIGVAVFLAWVVLYWGKRVVGSR